MSLTREQYKKIKAMNRTEMEQYLTNIHNIGWNAGVTEFSKKLAAKVERGIKNTSGIGEKRYTELLNNINAELTKPDDEEEAE